MSTDVKEAIDTKFNLDEYSVTYAKQMVELMTEQLEAVIKIRQPKILALFMGKSEIPEDNKMLILGALQAWSIWF